jgi:hypothetical protein
MLSDSPLVYLDLAAAAVVQCRPQDVSELYDCIHPSAGVFKKSLRPSSQSKIAHSTSHEK